MPRNAFSGDTIIKEGDADRSLFRFYIVEEGEARAYVLEDGEEVLMSHLGPGTKTNKTLPMLHRIVCASFMSTLAAHVNAYRFVADYPDFNERRSFFFSG